jgi:uncharacterized membrane protein
VVTQEERSLAMLMWIISIFISVIVPLIFVLTQREKPFVYGHSAQALTFHLALLVVGSVIAVVTCGFGAIVFIFGIIVPIVGAVKANRGESWDVPVSGGLSRKLFGV